MLTRKQKLEQNQNLLVEVRPEFAQALQNTLNFSSKIILTNCFYSTQGQRSLLDQTISQEKENSSRDGRGQARGSTTEEQQASLSLQRQENEGPAPASQPSEPPARFRGSFRRGFKELEYPLRQEHDHPMKTPITN